MSSGGPLRSGSARLRSVVLSAALLLPLQGCRAGFDRLALLEANYLAARGSFREAVSAYSRPPLQGGLEPYADYGLGVVYLALGEIEPALGRFTAATDSVRSAGPEQEDRELLYRSRYDSGLAYYRSGRYPQAVAEFRRALEIDGSRIDAKRNLELSLRAMNPVSAPAASSAPLETKSRTSQEPQALFDFIREKESDRWRSREWRAESAKTLDY